MSTKKKARFLIKNSYLERIGKFSPDNPPMRTLTQKGQEYIQQLAQKYQLSESAVIAMLQSVSLGGGTMAQFNIPELGGGGQWMQGGMTMVGDMFNYSLQHKVNSLCNDLASILYTESIFEPVPSPKWEEQGNRSQNSRSFGNWWPEEFGSPSSSGGQNNMRYAYFPSSKRLVVESEGKQTVYDALHHQVSGVSQQQDGLGYTLQFTSQSGNIDLNTLPVISPTKEKPSPEEKTDVNAETAPPETISPSPQEEDIIKTIERLAGLVKKNIITEAEFAVKKKELLGRL